MNLPALIRSVSPAIAAGIVVALCGITALCGAQPAAAVPKLDSKYTNKPQGLVLRFPAGWDLEDLGTQPGDRWDLLVLNPVENGNNAGIHLTVYRQKAKADELFQQLRADYGKPGGAVIGGEGAAEIGGQSSRFFTVRYTNRRPASPFNFGRQFGSASCAPPLQSAAIAHLSRRHRLASFACP
jgi:hypothetical protein